MEPKYSCSEPMYPATWISLHQWVTHFEIERGWEHVHMLKYQLVLEQVDWEPVEWPGPSEEGPCYHLNNNNWLASDQSRHCSSVDHHVVGSCWMTGEDVGWHHGEEYDAFVNIFEGGSLLYCNMSFEALLNVRKQLEGHSLTKSSQGLGMADSSVVWWACWSSSKWGLESSCCSAVVQLVWIQTRMSA